MEIKVEDIAGAHVEEGFVCVDCITPEEMNDLEEGNIVLIQTVENQDDILYFCDRCKKRL